MKERCLLQKLPCCDHLWPHRAWRELRSILAQFDSVQSLQELLQERLRNRSYYLRKNSSPKHNSRGYYGEGVLTLNYYPRNNTISLASLNLQKLTIQQRVQLDHLTVVVIPAENLLLLG